MKGKKKRKETNKERNRKSWKTEEKRKESNILEKGSKNKINE